MTTIKRIIQLCPPGFSSEERTAFAEGYRTGLAGRPRGIHHNSPQPYSRGYWEGRADREPNP